MTIKLGQKPDKLDVLLVKNADFVDGIRKRSDNWPVGLVVKIAFNDRDATEFDATVADDLISWDIDKAVVNALIARRPTWATLIYNDGGLDLIWAHGAPEVVLTR